MKLLFAGDLFYNYDMVQDDIRSLGGIFREREYLVIPNLEGGLGAAPDKRIWKRGACLKQDASIIDVLKTLSVKGVTLANNHQMDFGEEGLFKTLKMLDNNGFQHAGAGVNIEEALKPMEITGGGRTTAVFNFGWKAEETVYAGTGRPGCAPRENGLILKILKAYSSRYPEKDIIPVLHWGFEKNLYPMPFDIDLAHSICDIEGVKLLIGHHPHCPQPVEEYRGKRIYYSLGNFYFGKSRIKYSDKLYSHEPSNMSDYGIGVIYDTERGLTDHMVFCYDRAADRTEIKETDLVPERMPEIKDPEEYEKLIRSSRLGKNPILGTSPFINFIKVFSFNTKRNLFRLGILR